MQTKSTGQATEKTAKPFFGTARENDTSNIRDWYTRLPNTRAESPAAGRDC
ncbi:hypothetical protein [Nocardia sp. MW-W600-9]